MLYRNPDLTAAVSLLPSHRPRALRLAAAARRRRMAQIDLMSMNPQLKQILASRRDLREFLETLHG